MPNSDYTKPFTNVTELLPSVYQSEITKALASNVFNRYLTKDEMQNVVGTLSVDPNDPLRLSEFNIHRQNHQLQPLIYNKVATDETIMSFKDILREVETHGADTSKYAQWGSSYQYNFIPPVDLDKINNFSQYYWVNKSKPQYITIKNRLHQICTIISYAKSVVDGLTDIINSYLSEIDSVIKQQLRDSIEQMYPGLALLIDEKQYIQLNDPLNYTNTDGWDAVNWDPTIMGDWDDPLDGMDIIAVQPFTFIVSGNRQGIFSISPSFAFEVVGGVNAGVYETVISSYDITLDQTMIIVTQSIDVNDTSGTINVGIFDSVDWDPTAQPVGSWDSQSGDLPPLIPNPYNFMLQRDGWSATNFWTHISELPIDLNLNSIQQAQQPIIEYLPFIQLNEWSFSRNRWGYRASDSDTFIETELMPTELEILSERHRIVVSKIDATTFSVPGYVDFPAVVTLEFINGSTQYPTILSAVYNSVDDITVVSVDLVMFSIPGMIYCHLFDKSSSGDPWIGFRQHWLWIGKSAPVPIGPQLATSALDPYHVDYDPSRVVQVNAAGVTTNWYTLDGLSYKRGEEVRVYINGVRQYGNYQLGTFNSGTYTLGGNYSTHNAIWFTAPILSGVITVQTGPSAAIDEAYREVYVRISSDDDISNSQYVSLTQYNKIEQLKTSHTQYPLFDMYNMDHTHSREASPLWMFTESASYPVSPHVGRRIVVTGNTYSFDQLIFDDVSNRIYAYNEFDQRVGQWLLQLVWRSDPTNLVYVPRYIDASYTPVAVGDPTGDWELPQQITNNLEHQNKRTITTVELLQHFDSIISSQPAPIGYDGTISYKWGLQINPLYGAGGSIKEHSGGMDTFISSIMVKGINIPEVIQFAKRRYRDNQLAIRELLRDNLPELLQGHQSTNVMQYISDNIINMFESSDRLENYYNDTTMFNSELGLGVRNWVASLPGMGLLSLTIPRLRLDSGMGLYEVVHHDGHVSSPTLDRDTITGIIATMQKTSSMVRGSSIPPLSSMLNGGLFFNNSNSTLMKVVVNSYGDIAPVGLQEGELWFNSDTNLLYQLTNNSLVMVNEIDAWVSIDLNEVFCLITWQIEQMLYDVVKSYNLNVDVDLADIQSYQSFTEMSESKFLQYTKNNNIGNPYNSVYTSQNAFSWNYSQVNISLYNVLTPPSKWLTTPPSTWYTLYEDVYGTRYPHLEPWVLQGYKDKPDWWDVEYKSTNRRWSTAMWVNILAGAIPLGKRYPTGYISSGAVNDPLYNPLEGIQYGLISGYNCVPVNITDDVTSDGAYSPDDLLPPYYTSSNPSDISITTFGVILNTLPSSNLTSVDYVFGNNGPIEDTWRRSIDYWYDVARIGYEQDPIKFLHSTFGYDRGSINGLEVDLLTNSVPSHRDVVFHGDFIDGQVRKVFGLNQVFVQFLRYNGYDINVADVRRLWTDWRPKLGYQMSTFVDTEAVFLSNDSIQYDSSDFDVTTKTTYGLYKHTMDSLRVVIHEVGQSVYVHGTRTPLNMGADWRFRLTTANINSTTIKLFPVDTSKGVQSTFGVIGGGVTDTKWNHYHVDQTNVIEFNPGDVVDTLGPDYSGIQGVINLIDGYAAYLKSKGFNFNESDHLEVDPITGRNINWQLETELMIEQIYKGMASDKLPIQFAGKWNRVTVDIMQNMFSTGTVTNLMENGDTVQVHSTGMLPDPLTESARYYVVESTPDSFKLSAQPGSGVAINLQHMGRGVITVGQYRTPVSSPQSYHEVNPFKHVVVCDTQVGIIGNVHGDSSVDISPKPTIYNQYGYPIHHDNIRVYRGDLQSYITCNRDIPNTINPSDPIHIGGMDIYVHGMEHVILLKPTALDGALLYSDFLGVAINKMKINVMAQRRMTMRPNVGGRFLLNGKQQVRNIESSIEELQNMYDVHMGDETSLLTKSGRALIDFKTMPYMDELGITTKSQLHFYRGMIQHKGSLNAITAFINLRLFIDANVDEYWAYKVCDFGDAGKRNYPELMLQSTDVVTDKLLIQFTDDTDNSSLSDHIIVTNDDDRWVNLPLQVREFFSVPDANIKFATKYTPPIAVDGNELSSNRVIDLGVVVDDAVIISEVIPFSSRYTASGSSVTIPMPNDYIKHSNQITVYVIRPSISDEMVLQPSNTIEYNDTDIEVNTFRTPLIADRIRSGDIVIVEVRNGALVEGTHYTRRNGRLVMLSSDYNWSDKHLSVVGCIPRPEYHNPVKLIDDSSGTKLTDISMWDPSRGYHTPMVKDVIDVISSDPANYNVSLDGDINPNTTWGSKQLGSVWLDADVLKYVPYNDNTIFNDLDTRLTQWGSLESWARVELYEWVSSPVPPSQYANYVKTLDRDFAIGAANGVPRESTFVRVRGDDGFFSDTDWASLDELIFHINPLVDNTTVFAPPQYDGQPVEVYDNGRLVGYTTVVGTIITTNLIGNDSSYITYRIARYIPTAEQLNFNPSIKDDVSVNIQYTTQVKHVDIVTVDDNGIDDRHTYYFWARHTNTVHENNTTLLVAERDLTYNPQPFVVFDNIINTNGVYTYTRLGIRGLVNKIQSDNRYMLRFTWDTSLRDVYRNDDSAMSTKNIHSEWKMFRERQRFNITATLWNKLTESLSGRTLSNGAPVPSLDYEVYDSVNGTQYKYGLRSGQTFVDKQRGIEIVINEINNATYDLAPIDRGEFMSKYNFNTPIDVELTMNTIYNTFDAKHVNRIWFAVLYETLASNREFTDIMKTSWIQLDGVRLLDTTGTLM